MSQLDELLRHIPELSVIIDTFEQRVQPESDQQEADAHYSGKNKHFPQSALSK